MATRNISVQRAKTYQVNSVLICTFLVPCCRTLDMVSPVLCYPCMKEKVLKSCEIKNEMKKNLNGIQSGFSEFTVVFSLAEAIRNGNTDFHRLVDKRIVTRKRDTHGILRCIFWIKFKMLAKSRVASENRRRSLTTSRETNLFEEFF